MFVVGGFFLSFFLLFFCCFFLLFFLLLQNCLIPMGSASLGVILVGALVMPSQLELFCVYSKQISMMLGHESLPNST